MILLVTLLWLFFTEVASQGTPPPNDEIEQLKKEMAVLKASNDRLTSTVTKLDKQLSSIGWLQSQNYCILKKGQCPPGFTPVSLKTWLQRGASGHVNKESSNAYFLPWWNSNVVGKGMVATLHLEKETLGSVGDSYIRKKCIPKQFGDGKDICYSQLMSLIKDQNGNMKPYVKDWWDKGAGQGDAIYYSSIESNEFVLNACCK